MVKIRLRAVINYLLLFSSFINIFISSYIVLPFNIEKKTIDTSLNLEKQLEYYIEKNKIISTLSLGEEPKGLELYLSLNEYTFFLSNDACSKNSKSSYNPFLSSTYKNTTDYIDLYVNIKKYCRAIDQCSIYNDIYLNNNISISNLSFLFAVNIFSGKIDNSSQICGNLGLQIYNKNGNQFRNDYFINSLKQNNIISAYTWSILYLNNTVNKNDILNYTNKDYDGILICGIDKNDYQSIFKTNNIKTVKAEARSSSIYWDITNIKISYEFSEDKANNYESLDNRITFNNENNYITCTESYFNSIKNTFFKSLIENNICNIIEKIQPMSSSIIVCNKDIKDKLSEFPKLLFYHEELDFIFELTYNDLFIEYNDKILFLVIYNAYGQNLWSLGKIFMMKYPFIFDYDKKAISFVNIFNINKSDNNKNSENDQPSTNYAKIIIIILLILFGIIIGIIIGRIIWYKQRKKRANELEDDYEYNNDNKKENLKGENLEQNENNALYKE